MKKNFLKLYFTVTFIESLLISGVLSSRTAEKGFFLNTGFTAKNLFLFSAMMAVTFLSLGFFILTQRDHYITDQIVAYANNKRFFWVSVLFLLFLFLESFQDILFLHSEMDPILYSSYFRLVSSLLPVLIWGVLFSIQSLLGLVFISSGKHIRRLGDHVKLEYLIPFSILFVLGVGSYTDGYGFIPGTGDPLVRKAVGKFEPANAPLPGIHVTLIWGFVLVFFAVKKWLVVWWSKLGEVIDSHLLNMFLIWVAAFLIWVNVPIESNWSIDIPTEPETRIHPGSDAFYYEKEAHRLLAGEGFEDTSTHPMYSFFLSLLHLLGGAGYSDIIPYQIAVLAFIPVVLYRMTSFLHKRWSGVFVAALFILREYNHLLLADNISGAVPHMLSSENLALLGVALFLYLSILWAENPDQNTFLPWLAGGAIGFSILVRSELLAMFLGVGLGSILIFRSKKKIWGRGMMKMLIIVLLMIAPWMIRNWATTGKLTLDKGDFLSRKVQEYAGHIFSKPEDDHIVNTSDNSEISPGMGKLQNILHHISSSSELSILYLPSNHQPLLTLGSVIEFSQRQLSLSKQGLFSESYLERYTRSLPYWWFDWDGSLAVRSLIPLLGVILFISIGIGVIWEQWSLIVLIPLFAFFSHITIFALAGYSGSRFIKVVDWITLFYFGVGIGESTFWIINNDKKLSHFFSVQTRLDAPERNQKEVNPSGSRNLQILAVIAFLVAGLALPLSEVMIPSQYSERKLSNIIQEAHEGGFTDLTQLEEDALEQIQSTPGPIFLGKALYPRFFRKSQMLPDDRKGTLPSPGSDRIDFYLVGTENVWVSLPVHDPELVFPHAMDVIVKGEWVRNTEFYLERGLHPYFEAEKVIVLSEEGKPEEFILKQK